MLAAHPFIGISRSSWTGQLIHALLRRHRLKLNEAMELDSLETIAAMVARGFGVSIMPLSLSRALDDRIQIALLTEPQSAREIGLMHRNNHGREALISAVLGNLLAIPTERPTRLKRIALSS